MGSDRIVRVELATAEVPKTLLLRDKSILLSALSTHDDLRGYFFLASGMAKDKSLGVMFSNLIPINGNRFRLEIGTELPDLFPNVDGQPEYEVLVRAGNQEHALCISNVMCRVRFRTNDGPMHALMHRGWLPKVREGEFEPALKDASEELLRTFAAITFDIEGNTAEEAFENNCARCIDEMIGVLNRFLKMLPFVDRFPGRFFSVAYSTANLPCYFVLKGQAENDFGQGWVAPHTGRSSLNPPNLSSEESELLKEYLTSGKSPNDIDAMLHSAQAFAESGVFEYVLLLSVIAAEVATERFVKRRLKACGVSQARLEKAKADLKYSLMSNVILNAVVPIEFQPDAGLMGDMNRGRSLRNDLMHEGTLPTDQNEIRRVLASTKRYVEYLRSTEAAIELGEWSRR